LFFCPFSEQESNAATSSAGDDHIARSAEASSTVKSVSLGLSDTSVSGSKNASNLTPADQPDSAEAAPSASASTPNTPKSTIAHHRRRGLIRHRNKWNHQMHPNPSAVVGSSSGNHFNNAIHRHRMQQQQQQQQQQQHMHQMQFAVFNQQFGQFHQQQSQPQSLQAYAYHAHPSAHRTNIGLMGPPSMMQPSPLSVHQMQARSSMIPPHMPMVAHTLHHAHSSHRKESHHYRGSNNRRREQGQRSNHKSSRNPDQRSNLRPFAGPTLGKRLVPAPYNTTQFLMDDHKCREPELDGFSDLICKPGGGRDTDTEGALDADVEDGPEPSMANRRLHDRHLHTVNDESSSEEFYSSPDDEQDFMEKQFTETYDNIHAERLDLMSKTELMQEVLLLEERVKSLESQLKRHSDSNADSKDAPDDGGTQPEIGLDDESQASHLRSRLQLVTVDSSQSGPICDQSEDRLLRSSRSSSSSSSLTDSDCSSCVSDDPMIDVSGTDDHIIATADSDPDMQQLVEYLKRGINGVRPQVQQQLKRLLDENNKLKMENERLKVMLEQKPNILEAPEIEFAVKENV
jgi:uncharacterized small protein (DUF1192 family)